MDFCVQVDGRPQEPFLRSRWSFKFLQLKIADYFAAILHQLIIHVRPVFSVVSHLEIYFDFAHRQSRLNFRLLLVLSFRCTSVRDSYCWAWLLRLELFYCPSSLSSASTGVTSRTSASANFRLEGGGTPVAAGCSYPVERSWFE